MFSTVMVVEFAALEVDFDKKKILLIVNAPKRCKEISKVTDTDSRFIE